jgi:hypothetical protein
LIDKTKLYLPLLTLQCIYAGATEFRLQNVTCVILGKRSRAEGCPLISLENNIQSKGIDAVLKVTLV